MWKKICIFIVVMITGFGTYVALQPATFRVARSAKMSAAPSAVFAEVNDFHRWNDWSPWAKLDPSMQTTYEGAPAGVGSIYHWAGNRQVGKGRMEITESRPVERVGIKLDFLEPFAANNVTEFTFKTEGAQTVVTWSMAGENNFMAKTFSIFFNMDKMVGGDFEKGLAQLKAVSESAKKQ